MLLKNHAKYLQIYRTLSNNKQKKTINAIGLMLSALNKKDFLRNPPYLNLHSRYASRG